MYAMFLTGAIVLAATLGNPQPGPQTPAPDAPVFEAHFSRGDGTERSTHVHVTINRPGVKELKVAVFDEAGEEIGNYKFHPKYTGDRTQMSIDFKPGIAEDIHSARVVGFITGERGESEPAFDTGKLNAVPMTGCASFCMAARRDCNDYCWLLGYVEAVFSCGPDGLGGCEASCYCCNPPGTGCNQ